MLTILRVKRLGAANTPAGPGELEAPRAFLFPSYAYRPLIRKPAKSLPQISFAGC